MLNPKDETIQVKVTQERKDEIIALALKLGLNQSDLMRVALKASEGLKEDEVKIIIARGGL